MPPFPPLPADLRALSWAGGGGGVVTCEVCFGTVPLTFGPRAVRLVPGVVQTKEAKVRFCHMCDLIMLAQSR